MQDTSRPRRRGWLLLVSRGGIGAAAIAASIATAGVCDYDDGVPELLLAGGYMSDGRLASRTRARGRHWGGR